MLKPAFRGRIRRTKRKPGCFIKPSFGMIYMVRHLSNLSPRHVILIHICSTIFLKAQRGTRFQCNLAYKNSLRLVTCMLSRHYYKYNTDSVRTYQCQCLGPSLRGPGGFLKYIMDIQTEVQQRCSIHFIYTSQTLLYNWFYRWGHQLLLAKQNRYILG